jgi:hypothetical protein
MTPEEFQQQYMPYAQGVSQRTGLDPRMVLAQAALETGWGQSAPNNNFFGIKSHGQPGGSNLMTQEFENGRMVSRPQSFRGYENPEQSFQGYADFILNNPRYGDVMAQGDLAGQIGAMGQSGYATDPDYASKLSSIARRFGGDVPDAPMRARVSNSNTPTGGILSNEGNQMAQPQQPQGLLGSMGIQRRDPNAQGETSQPFYNRRSFGDTLARMAPALGRMGVMGLEGPAQAALDSRNERQGDERARAAQAGRVNQTIEWMRSQPNGEQFAAMAEQVGIEPAMQAMQVANAAPDRTSAMQNYEFMLAQGIHPATALERAFSGGTNIQVGPDGQPAAQIGTISPGYQAIPDGNGGYTMSPIPGGPADTDLGALAVKAEASAESNAAGSINVLEKVNAVRAEVSENPFASGLLGSIAGSIPGTGAYDTAQTAGTIKANLGFDRLTQMRAESPTGGALGSVSQMELDRLESTIASLDLGQSREQILRNLDDIERQYTRILENAYSTGDPAALDAILGGRPSFMGGGATTPPAGGSIDVDPALLEFMSPEERALFQ